MIRKVVVKVMDAIVCIVAVVLAALLLSRALGINYYVVQSGSMEPQIMTGSLCFVNTNADYDDIKAGDIIAFRIATGDLVTHRAVAITDSGIETKGDNSENSDGISTTRANFIGKTLFSIPEVGKAVVAVTQPRGIILCATGIAVIFVLGMMLDKENKKEESPQT